MAVQLTIATISDLVKLIILYIHIYISRLPGIAHNYYGLATGKWILVEE